MKFRRKPEYVDAYQWFNVSEYREGYRRDVDYYRHPNHDGKTVCKSCGKTLHEHGYMDQPFDTMVCPGDWIVTKANGEKYACKRILFESQFEPVENEHEPIGAQRIW